MNNDAATPTDEKAAAEMSPESAATTAQKKAPFKSKKTKSFIIKSASADAQADFSQMPHDDLVAEAVRLRNHVVQLKNLLNKVNSRSGLSAQEAGALVQELGGADAAGAAAFKKKAPKERKERPFDFSRFNRRHVLLKFAYLGWNYQGYTVQEGISETVENRLFEAFKRTKLVESRETSNYHRCGRTDKGVSAFCQVVSIDFRSNCAAGKGVVVNPIAKVTSTNIDDEINYVKLLNGVLPDDIRAIAWCPIEPEFSARFDCIERTYRYFIPKGDLDIEAMKDAGRRLVGEKDYRNFCKMDVANGVVTFFRRIDDVRLTVLGKDPDIYSTVELVVVGSSFLWHQIRCIVAVLLLVGQGKEPPSIIDDLLDIEKYPRKPQYTICSETPLVLFDCQYENVEWIQDRHELEKLIKHFQDVWMDNHTKATIVKRMIDFLDADLGRIKEKPEDVAAASSQSKAGVQTNQRNLEQPYALLQGKSQSFNYVKFEERQKADSLESRVAHYVKRRRLDSEIYDKINEANNLAQSLNIYKPSGTSQEPKPESKDGGGEQQS